MKKLLVLIILSTTLLHCSNDDCGDPNITYQTFTFEIVDKISGENLFTNGTYLPEQIQITNTISNFETEFTFLSENNVNLIQVNSASWETDIVNLTFTIADNLIFELYSDGDTIVEACYSYTVFNDIFINESEFDYNAEIAIYTILVE